MKNNSEHVISQCTVFGFLCGTTYLFNQHESYMNVACVKVFYVSFSMILKELVIHLHGKKGLKILGFYLEEQ